MTSTDLDSTAYRLLADEPVADGIKRVVLARVNDAISHLEGTDGETRDDAIHEARKDLKKTRSAIRLVRDALRDEIYKRENSHYGDVGRTLSGFRDAEALIEAIDSLVERFQGEGSRRFAPLRASFEKDLRAHRDGDEQPSAMAAAATALREGRGRVESWPLSGGDWSLLKPGLLRTYRRGRKRLRDAERDPSDANLHEWRKRVKDLWYQLRLIRDVEIDLAGQLIGEIDVLADHLGDDHDLALLRAAADERRDRFDKAADRRLLLELVDRRRGELRFAAFSLGSSLHDQKPKAFVKQLKKARR
jgi:CHAD domain-containing protein